MKSIFKILAIICIFVTSACAGFDGPTPEQIANAYYGREMTNDECAKLSRQEAQKILKDAPSAKYKYGVCRKSHMFLGGHGTLFGYIFPVEINAKNSFGGYTGYDLYYFVNRDGRVIARSKVGKYGVPTAF